MFMTASRESTPPAEEEPDSNATTRPTLPRCGNRGEGTPLAEEDYISRLKTFRRFSIQSVDDNQGRGWR
jgi:hypothetical protein